MTVNALGVMLCYKHAARQMIKQGGGGRLIGELQLLSSIVLQAPDPPWYIRCLFDCGKARCARGVTWRLLICAHLPTLRFSEGWGIFSL